MFYYHADSISPLSIDVNPMIGNGRLASVIYSIDLFHSGLFNGKGNSTPSHRARIPSTINTYM